MSGEQIESVGIDVNIQRKSIVKRRCVWREAVGLPIQMDGEFVLSPSPDEGKREKHKVTAAESKGP